ncbi:hypothetical protein SAMN05192566_1549 [Methylophilus rhizosphaerae]|uniref:DUF7669 domain-containing protein n=1 Tax=Methylophilus rhizosphaerae TaxID=492660 RepID=A0A1G9CNQ9_9PROT|nr:HNH endonuclease signature motif containing protein [Methylophilus rhizosphaerae]SDK53216.1 hypothetical protein SAMN05192566_1549 [Methylophilus rhizosphaerae]
MAIYAKPVRVLIKEMIADLAPTLRDSFDREEALAWFKIRYPKIKAGTISAHLVRFSINAPSRLHHNPKSDEDVLYQIDKSRFRLFNPSIDGKPFLSKIDEEENLFSWNKYELSTALDAYIEMINLEAAQLPYSKLSFYRRVAEKLGRSVKSIEYRMQNISAVLDEMNKPWITGLKPAGNVGTKVKAQIVALIKKKESQTNKKDKISYKEKLPSMRNWLIKIAKQQSVVTYSQMREVFGVDRFSLRHAMDFLGHQAAEMNEPIITALIVSKETGLCSSGFAKEFGVSDDESERKALYSYWRENFEEPSNNEAETNEIEIKAARFVTVEARPDQAAFRRRVFLACNGKCVVSGCDVVKALDAAHKQDRDWRLGHNTSNDGYLLRKDLHALYDNRLMVITESGEIQFDQSVLSHYQEFMGKKIIRANDPI